MAHTMIIPPYQLTFIRGVTVKVFDLLYCMHGCRVPFAAKLHKAAETTNKLPVRTPYEAFDQATADNITDSQQGCVL